MGAGQVREKSLLRGNKLKVSSSRGEGLVLSFKQLGSRPRVGRGSGQKNSMHYDKKSPLTYSPSPHCNANKPEARGMTLSPPAGLNMALGKREEAEGHFREGQLPHGPQML